MALVPSANTAGQRENSPIFDSLEGLPGEFDGALTAQPVVGDAIQPRDKLEKYRDAAMDFYQNGELAHGASEPDAYGTDTGSLAKILADAPMPRTPREPIETVTREEFNELTARLRAVDKRTEKTSRSWCHRCQEGLKWYHIVMAVIINDMILIAVGASVGSAFYSIEPLQGGSFRADRIEVEGLQIDPDQGSVRVLLESKDDDAELALVSFAGEPAALSLTDASAPSSEGFRLLSVQEFQGAQRTLKLQQGEATRFAVASNGNGTDVRLDPDATGKVMIKGGLGLDFNRIDTGNTSLELVPAFDRDLLLEPSGSGAVVVNDDLKLFGYTVATKQSPLLLKPVAGKNILLDTAQGGFVQVSGPLNHSGGDVRLQSNLTVMDVDARSFHSVEGVVFDSSATIGNEVSDAIDFNGHIKSCGTSSIERYFCDKSKLVFDADDDGKALILYAPDPPTTDPATGRNFEITFPVETGTVLTTKSKDSELIRVGKLEQGQLVYGFGSAEVASLTSRGASNLFGDCTIGISRDNRLNVKGHLAEQQLQFDFNSDGVRYIMRVPDPSENKADMDCYISTGSTDECVRQGLMKTERIDFPQETGTILTDVSTVSQLQEVGNLHKGSLRPGFGSAYVANLTVPPTGFTNLASDVRIGATSSNTLRIESRLLNENLIFDANSDGKSMSIWIPDPLLSQTIYFPERSGKLLTDTSTYSVLTQVGALETGSIVAGFGPIHAQSFVSTGDAILHDDVQLGDVDTDVVEVNGHIVSHEFLFDANSDRNRFSLQFPDPPAGTPSRNIAFPLEDGYVLTTTSLRSNLTEVAALHQGSLVSGFGSATITDLTATGDTQLNSNVKLCNDRDDFLTINGRILDTQLVIAHPLAPDINYKLSFPRVSSNTELRFPIEQHAGTLLTTASDQSSLTAVAQLTSGSIRPGFGSIHINEPISGASVTSAGLLRAVSSAEIGSQPGDRLSLRATVEVRGAAPNGTLMTTFSVDPREGDVFVKGVLSVQGAISALAAPFFVDTVRASTLLELVNDQGISIEGLIFKDGGFPFAKTDAIQEFTDGQGVSVEGVTMKGGALTAETTVAGTSPIGNSDLVTLINEGRDFMMRDTRTSIKFRQWHQGIPDNTSYASDSGAISVGTEDDWRVELASRNAFMGFSTVEQGNLRERVRIAANGDLLVNGGKLTSYEESGNMFVSGNVSIGENQEGARSLLVQSEDEASILRVVSKTQQASLSVTSGADSSALLAVVSGVNSNAVIRLQDPAEKMAGSIFDFVLDGNVKKSRRLQAGDGIVVESCDAIDSVACATVALVGTPGQTPRGLCTGAAGLNCAYTPADPTNNAAEACVAARAQACASVVLDGNETTCTNVQGCVYTAATEQALHTMRLVNSYKNYRCENVTTIVGVLNPRNVTRLNCAWQQASPVTIFEVTSDPDERLGNFAVSGHLSSLTANIQKLLEARNVKVTANTQLGDSIDDRITLLGSLAHENISVKVNSTGKSLMLQFPDPTADRLLSFPDESGSILSSTSNFSTLTAVAELTVGSIGKGFGHAEVASLGAEGDIQSKGEIIFGDQPSDGVNIKGHFRETQFIFDRNSDFLTTTLVVTDPSPSLPPFRQTCEMVNGSALNVFVPWEHDDFRKFRWTDTSLSVNEAIRALTDEVVALSVVPIDNNTSDLLFKGALCVATDKDICAAAPLGGTPFACQDAGSCLYTPGSFDANGNPIVESCVATFTQSCENVDMNRADSASICGATTGCTTVNVSRTIEDVNCAYECTDIMNASGSVLRQCAFNAGSVDPMTGLTKPIRTLRDVLLQYMFNDIIATQAAGVGHTIKFPQADGTLLHKFNGSTHLDGRIFVGGNRQDSVFINGVLQGGIRVEGQIEGGKLGCTNSPLYWTSQTCEDVVPDILALGAATCNDYWSKLGIRNEDTMIGEWCPNQCYPRCSAQGSALRFTNQDMNQEACVATDTNACASVVLAGTAAACTAAGNCTYTPASTGVAEACVAASLQVCANVKLDGDSATCNSVPGCSHVPRQQSGDEIIIAVPQYTKSQVLTLPDNTGTLLSSTSSYSTLQQLGVLKGVTVAGVTKLDGETHVGKQQVTGRTPIYVDGAVMQYAGGHTLSFGSELYGSGVVTGCADWGACVAVDATACSNVVLTGNPAANQNACENSGIACVYTAADVAGGVAQSCTATLIQTCEAIDLTAGQPLSVCTGVVGCTHPGTCFEETTETYNKLTKLAVTHQTSTGTRATQPAGDQTLTLPFETGTLISSGSDFRVITGLGNVAYGSLAQGFGAAHIAELRVSGNSRLEGALTTVGSDSSDQISMLGTLIGSSVLRFEGQVDNTFDLTVSQPVFTKTRNILIPDEDGQLLTTTSNVSTLQEVGALDAGSIVAGFGSAHPNSLTVTTDTILHGNTQIGDDSLKDRIDIQGYIGSQQVKFDTDGIGGSMSLMITDPPTDDVTIRFPAYDGSVVLDTTKITGITGTAALDLGSITAGFGPITVGVTGGISTTNGQPIVASGDLVAEGATIFSHSGVPASDNIVIPEDKTLVRITPGNDDRVNYYTMPDGEAGELLVIQNDDNMEALPLDEGVSQNIPPSDIAVFFHIGYRWVEISRLLEWRLDGSSRQKVPYVAAEKRLTASDGLFWDNGADHMTIKSSNDQAKLSLESFGNCPGFLQHEAACREQTSRFIMQLSPTPNIETGTEMVPFQLKARHKYGDKYQGYKLATSSADEATCGAIPMGVDGNANAAACAAATRCTYTADDPLTALNEESCVGGAACSAARMEGESCFATDTAGCAAIVLNGISTTCTQAPGLSCAYTAANLHIGIAEACTAVKKLQCAAIALNGIATTCTNVPGCSYTINSDICAGTSKCQYIPDDPATAADETACKASLFEVAVPIIAEACVAEDATACAAIVPSGNSQSCAVANAACNYTAPSAANNFTEACVATRATACADVKLNGYPATCSGVPGCKHVPASGLTKFKTVERTILSAGDVHGFVVSDMNVTMKPTTAMAIRDTSGKLDLFSVDVSTAGSESVDIHASGISMLAGTWPDDSSDQCSSLHLVETCEADDKAICAGVVLTGTAAACTNAGDCAYTPASPGVPEACVASKSQMCASVVLDGNPTTCTALTGCVHFPDAGEAACLAAGTCAYTPDNAATPASEESCRPICDPCACDLDGIVDGFNTGRPRCDQHYGADPVGAASIALNWRAMNLDSSHNTLLMTDFMCMVHPDCKTIAGIISSHTGGTRSLPYRICSPLQDNPVATDCNDPATNATMQPGWQDETLVHGNMNIKASRLKLQRKVVNYMQGRKSRSFTDVMSFSADGSLSLAGTTTDLTASESFNIYTPSSGSGSRRRLVQGQGITVFGLQNLGSGSETAIMGVSNLTIVATTNTALTSNKVTFQDSDEETLVIDKAAGVRIANANSAGKSVTIVTGTTTFRSLADDKDVLKLEASVAGQESLSIQTPILSLDTRTLMQDGVNKYGGDLTLATRSTILQTTNSLGQSFPMLTAEDKGINCAVNIDVWTNQYGKTHYFTVDFGTQQYGLAQWGNNAGPYRIQLQLPAGEHFLTHHTTQCAGDMECKAVGGVCAGNVPNGPTGAADPGDVTDGRAATTGCTSCTSCTPLTALGWAGGRVRVSDASGTTLNVGNTEQGSRPGCSAGCTYSPALWGSGTSTYFKVGSNGRCERIELRMQAEYTTMSDRAGTTPYLIIDAQDSHISGHEQFLSLSAPMVRAGELTSVVKVNGKQVSIQAGGVDAFVATNAVALCSSITPFAVPGHANNQAQCVALRINPNDAQPACTYTAASIAKPESCLPAAWADMSVEMKAPMVFTEKATFNGPIQMAQGAGTVGLKATTLTLSNPEQCVAIDAANCEAITLGTNNAAVCTTGVPTPHGWDCAYTPRVITNGVEFQAEACGATHSAACAAVVLNGIPSTCTSVAGCKHISPTGTVSVDSQKTRIMGQDIFVQGKCPHDPSAGVTETSDFTFWAAHCSSVPMGTSGWKVNMQKTKIQCDANVNWHWLESQCERQSDGAIVESGRTALDCSLRKQTVSNCIAYCSDPRYTSEATCQANLKTWSPGSQVRVSANTVSLQADGMDLVRLSAARSDPTTEPARKYFENSAWGDASASDATEVYLSADVIRARNKADTDNLLHISTTAASSSIVMSAQSIRVGTKYYATPRFVWYNGNGAASTADRNAQTGMCMVTVSGGGQVEQGGTLESQCTGAGRSWRPSTCTRIADSVQVETNHLKSRCDARNSAQQAVSVEGDVVTIDAANEVRLTATNMVNMVSDLRISKNVAFSHTAVPAAEEIIVSADTTVLLVTSVTGQQQNAVSLPRPQDGADVGNILMIYNDDDNPLAISTGNVAAKSAAMLFRTDLGWIKLV